MVDAGWRGTSARWLTRGGSGAPASCTKTLRESAGRRWRASASSTGPGNPPAPTPAGTESAATSTAPMAAPPGPPLVGPGSRPRPPARVQPPRTGSTACRRRPSNARDG